MEKDFFAQKASDYEKDGAVKTNVNNIADAICKEIVLTKDMKLMDFGSGTGFLLQGIAPFVAEIVAVDVSPAMTKELEGKKDEIACKLSLVNIDLTKEKLNDNFDGIISSMTFHHIEDIASIFKTLFNLLKNDGFIAIADLDTEKGDFHTEDTGVHHFGFDRNEFVKKAEQAGFKNVKIQTASTINKEHGKFSVFLLTGNK